MTGGYPSILIWGVQNEITIGGKDVHTEKIVSELNALGKELDPSRVTAQAQVGHHPTDDSMNRITDLLGYNNYAGWYYGAVEDMGQWLDKFHADFPEIPIGLTEYGCEAVVKYHTNHPERSDYTEEYQTHFHHEMIKTWNSRPWIWGTFVWNMFDFASDFRDEGGVKGMNNKGLVTHDRSLKKDSFFIYKAYWSEEPVLRIASRRFVNRPKGRTEVRIITNLPQAELFMDGRSLGVRKADENLVVFDGIPLKKGVHTLVARAASSRRAVQTGVDLPASASEITDSCVICGVAGVHPSYAAPPGKGLMEGVVNWFEEDGGEVPPFEFPECKYSVRDKIGEILKNPEGEAVLRRYMAPLFEHAMFAMAKAFTLEKIADMKPEDFPLPFVSKINGELNKIDKP